MTVAVVRIRTTESCNNEMGNVGMDDKTDFSQIGDYSVLAVFSFI